jgi:hypothetical protein
VVAFVVYRIGVRVTAGRLLAQEAAA